MDREDKVCKTCGRAIQWRRRWADQWHELRYCSKRCRGTKPNALDRAIEACLIDALADLARGQSVDPFEACEALGSGQRFEERVFNAARRLAASHNAALLCDGRVADPSHAKRPFTLSLPR